MIKLIVIILSAGFLVVLYFAVLETINYFRGK